MQGLLFLECGKRKDKEPVFILKEQPILYLGGCAMWFKKKEMTQFIVITYSDLFYFI